jgi:hypothetical protein
MNLIWRLDLFLIAIVVELGYRYVVRSISRQGPKGEPDVPIAAESEVTNFC